MAVAVLALLALSGAAATPTSSKVQPWWKHLASEQPIPITQAQFRGVPTEYSTPMLIARYGYPSESHTVRTNDGYLLGVHRIPNPGKPAVFLQHGILSCSADWVVLGPQKALAFMLYDAGYDVWMGNFRGNSYSRAHERKSPKDKDFWDFSWHEMGLYDVPAMIDYILEKTGHKSLVYVAHSQGTTAFLVMASMRPDYNEKVKAFIALAPIAFMGDIRSLPLKLLAKGIDQIEFILNVLGIGEFLPSNALISYITSKVCADGSMLQPLCTNILFLIAGFDTDQLDTEKLPDILKNIPAGASTKQFIHFGQIINTDKFRQYDYGMFKNLIRYQSMQPPSYPLNKVTCRVFLHYATNDLLATPKGVQKLKDSLTNVKLVRRVPHATYNHLDFTYGRGSRKLVYDEVMDSIAEVFADEQNTFM